MNAISSPEQVGKLVRGNLYFHVSAIGDIPDEYRTLAHMAMDISERSIETDFNVIKVARDANLVSLLNYTGFFEDPFPRF